MPVDAVYLWLLTRVFFCCTRGLGCNAHPAFPAPSVISRVVCLNNSGISCRETAKARSQGLVMLIGSEKIGFREGAAQAVRPRAPVAAPRPTLLIGGLLLLSCP